MTESNTKRLVRDNRSKQLLCVPISTYVPYRRLVGETAWSIYEIFLVHPPSSTVSNNKLAHFLNLFTGKRPHHRNIAFSLWWLEEIGLIKDDDYLISLTDPPILTVDRLHELVDKLHVFSRSHKGREYKATISTRISAVEKIVNDLDELNSIAHPKPASKQHGKGVVMPKRSFGQNNKRLLEKQGFDDDFCEHYASIDRIFLYTIIAFVEANRKPYGKIRSPKMTIKQALQNGFFYTEWYELFLWFDNGGNEMDLINAIDDDRLTPKGVTEKMMRAVKQLHKATGRINIFDKNPVRSNVPETIGGRL